MSAFISFVAPQAALLFTDGVVLRDGVLSEVMTKVWCAKRVPLAVTFRGTLETGVPLAKRICESADEIGAEATIEGLQDFVHRYRDETGVYQGDNADHVLVAACLPGVGGVHRTFSVAPRQYRKTGETQIRDLPAYHVHEPDVQYTAGTSLANQDILDAGLGSFSNEDIYDYGRRTGLRFMEMMRMNKGKRFGSRVEDDFIIGGKVDQTVIGPHGIRTQTVKRWPDEIGLRLDPFRNAGLSRAERRRLARA